MGRIIVTIRKRLLSATAVAAVAIGGTFVVSDSARAQGESSFGFHPTNPAIIAARSKFFGAENVDQRSGAVRTDRVLVSWLTNATMAASIKGRVILLDTYLNRPEVAPPAGQPDLRRTPINVDDMVNIRPEAIFLGHGHGDHADNAAYVAKNSGATIYASPETCDAMQQDVARLFSDPNTANGGKRLIPDALPAKCIGVVSRGSQPGAEVVTLDQLQPAVGIIAFKHIHSGSVPTDTDFNAVPVINDSDSRESSIYPTTLSLTPGATPQPGQMNLTTSGGAGVGGPISLVYQFVVCDDPNHFSMVWHNTTGPLKEGAGTDPGLPSPAIGAKLFSIMDKLPQTDVEFGSVVSLGYATNGERDILLYLQHLKPQIYVNLHTTNVAAISSSLRFKKAYLQTISQDSKPSPSGKTYVTYTPEIRWWVDPDDYLRPQVFDPSDPRWSNHEKNQRIAQQRYTNNARVCH
jgi:hypothetical protein